MADAFRAITVSLVTRCVLPLKAPPPDRNLVNVFVDCVPITQSTEDADGTFAVDNSALTITLDGAICESIQVNGAQRVDIMFGCPPIL